MVRRAAALLAGGALLGVAATGANASPTRSSTGSSTVWLCRPGLVGDACALDVKATAISPTGARSIVLSRPVPSAGRVDCFYVYPTVSRQLSSNSTLTIASSEIDVAEAQAAPFSADCRIWAPMYRQRTLVSLLSGLGSDPAATDVAYASVLSAWRDYLAHDNDGRPFVLIGHSQGAAMLIRLLRQEIDSKPALRSRLVAAILLGGNVEVPTGKLVGGTFSHIPACVAPSSIGCVIAYSSFPGEPPSNSLFGRPGRGVSLQSDQTSTKGLQVLCVNPASLRGGAGTLAPEFLTATQALSGSTVLTPFVEYPALYRAKCESAGGATYLDVVASLSTHDTRPRVGEIDGPQWGFHVDDVSLALGNLVADVAAEESAYLATRH